MTSSDDPFSCHWTAREPKVFFTAVKKFATFTAVGNQDQPTNIRFFNPDNGYIAAPFHEWWICFVKHLGPLGVPTFCTYDPGRRGFWTRSWFLWRGTLTWRKLPYIYNQPSHELCDVLINKHNKAMQHVYSSSLGDDGIFKKIGADLLYHLRIYRHLSRVQNRTCRSFVLVDS